MAGTINAANVSIGFDASKLQIGVNTTRGEMNKLRAMINDSVSNTDKYNQKLDLLKKAYEAGAISADRFQAAQAALAQKMGIASAEIDKQAAATQRMSRFANMPGVGGRSGGGMASIVGALGGPTTLGLAGIAMAAKASLDLASGVEQAATAFEVLTGSAAKASQMVGDMRRLDAESPLAFTDLMQAGKTLLGYGMSAEQVMPTLEALGAVSMGDANKLQSLSLAMGQVTAAGRLTGQEVLQMVNAGFNPLQIISEQTGKSMSQLRDEMAEGKITVEMVTEALKAATSEGGRFAGMNEKLAGTTAGAMAKLKSSLQSVGMEIGNIFAPMVKFIAAWGAWELQRSAKTMRSVREFLADPDGMEKEMQRRRDLDAAYWRLMDPAERLRREEEQKRKELEAQQAAQDAITKKAKEELEARQNMPKSANQLQAEEAAGADFQSKVKQIEAEYRKMQLGREKFERAEFKNTMDNVMAIGSEEDKQIAKEAMRQYDSIKEYEAFQERKKKSEEATKKAEEDRKKLAGEVKAMEDRFADPRKRVQEAFREIERLKKGGLSDESVRKARMDAAEKAQSERDNGVAATIAPALQAGSAEAYKFLLQRNEGQNKILERQLMVAKELKELAKKQVEATKKIVPVSRAR